MGIHFTIDRVIAVFDKRTEFGSKVSIVKEGIFLMSNINKCGIQARHQFLDSAYKNIPNGEIVEDLAQEVFFELWRRVNEEQSSVLEGRITPACISCDQDQCVVNHYDTSNEYNITILDNGLGFIRFVLNQYQDGENVLGRKIQSNALGSISAEYPAALQSIIEIRINHRPWNGEEVLFGHVVMDDWSKHYFTLHK